MPDHHAEVYLGTQLVRDHLGIRNPEDLPATHAGADDPLRRLAGVICQSAIELDSHDAAVERLCVELTSQARDARLKVADLSLSGDSILAGALDLERNCLLRELSGTNLRRLLDAYQSASRVRSESLSDEACGTGE
ncbi:hypothetical protein ACFVFJ_48170 [Streptomyces sp. NPDC057717]|uniref:hypothetical protein n=1 Tax=Streptomyces sp. NPDC057717 TaxID=3346224 RepID=UPI0036CBC485